MNTRTLYVGIDDSNHGNKAKPAEVILATFSIYPTDSYIQDKIVKRRRNHAEAISWLELPERDYRFTVLTDPLFATRIYNIPLVAPFLIKDYLNGNPDINSLEIHIDGAILPVYRDKLTEELREFSDDVQVSNFVKAKVQSFGPRRKLCTHQMRSLLIHHADILANALTRGMNIQRKHENQVDISLESLLEKEKAYSLL